MNTNTKHTPGPWYYTGEYINTATGDNICRIMGRITLRDGVSDANAALIAAAPELLEALKGLVAHAHQCAHFGDMKLLERADSAIEKAEGL